MILANLEVPRIHLKLWIHGKRHIGKCAHWVQCRILAADTLSFELIFTEVITPSPVGQAFLALLVEEYFVGIDTLAFGCCFACKARLQWNSDSSSSSAASSSGASGQ